MTESGQIPKFLSLEPNNTNQLCYSVPLEITAQFEGDMLGNWETSPDFQQNNSVFNIRFDGSAITTEQYQNVMLSFNSKLQSLSEKAARRDSG